MLGQLPIECLTPDLVFDKVGVDYAGPFYIKYGHVRKPTVVKTYASVFVSLSVKAVRLELVSELTTEAFLAYLRRFISRRGKQTLIWSDHGTNLWVQLGRSKNLLHSRGHKMLSSSFVQHKIYSGSSFLNTLLILVAFGRQQ